MVLTRTLMSSYLEEALVVSQVEIHLVDKIEDLLEDRALLLQFMESIYSVDLFQFLLG
jgi:hypothetical protein